MIIDNKAVHDVLNFVEHALMHFEVGKLHLDIVIVYIRLIGHRH